MKRRRNSINSVQRRLHIEATLAHYPHVTAVQLSDIISWFRREASAMEVASLASNPAIQPQYRQFRNQHIDRLSVGEIALCIGLGAILIVTVAVLVAMP